MQCAVCHRRINKPAALSHGLPVGPRCSVKLGLVTPKPRLPSMGPRIVVRVDEDQIPLFQTEGVL